MTTDTPTVYPELVDSLDEITRAIYLEVPSAQVVLFQGVFEIFEGVGIVRTLSIRKSLICILTTADYLAECFRILGALSHKMQSNSMQSPEMQSPEMQWRQVARPEEATQQLYLGYFGKH